jgi:hypothetical protein
MEPLEFCAVPQLPRDEVYCSTAYQAGSTKLAFFSLSSSVAQEFRWLNLNVLFEMLVKLWR